MEKKRWLFFQVHWRHGNKLDLVTDKHGVYVYIYFEHANVWEYDTTVFHKN
jgi:hypothetical protein